MRSGGQEGQEGGESEPCVCPVPWQPQGHGHPWGHCTPLTELPLPITQTPRAPGVREVVSGLCPEVGKSPGRGQGSPRVSPTETSPNWKGRGRPKTTGSLGDRATSVTQVPGLGASVTARHPASPAALEAGGKVAPTSQAFSTKSPLVLVFPQSLVTGDNFTQNAKGRKEAKAGTSRNARGPLGVPRAAPRALPWHPSTPHGSPLAHTHTLLISDQRKGLSPASLPSVPRTQPDAWEAQCSFLLCSENSPVH